MQLKLSMRCPICEREFEPAASTAKPFCSERCRLMDLGQWLDEGYSMPGLPLDELAEESESFESEP